MMLYSECITSVHSTTTRIQIGVTNSTFVIKKKITHLREAGLLSNSISIFNEAMDNFSCYENRSS